MGNYEVAVRRVPCCRAALCKNGLSDVRGSMKKSGSRTLDRGKRQAVALDANAEQTMWSVCSWHSHVSRHTEPPAGTAWVRRGPR